MRRVFAILLALVSGVGGLLAANMLVIYAAHLLNAIPVKRELAGLSTPLFLALLAGGSGVGLFFAYKELRLAYPKLFEEDVAKSYRVDTGCWSLAILLFCSPLLFLVNPAPMGALQIDLHGKFERMAVSGLLLFGMVFLVLALIRAKDAKRRRRLTAKETSEIARTETPIAFGATLFGAMQAVVNYSGHGPFQHAPWLLGMLWVVPWWPAAIYWWVKSSQLLHAEPPAEGEAVS